MSNEHFKEEYYNPYGIWEVTTEGDCEGRSTKHLGIWEGFIDQIAFHLADKAEYTLEFELVNIHTPEESKDPVRDSVNIKFGLDSGLYKIENGADTVAEYKKVFKDRPVHVNTGTGNFHASVRIENISGYKAADARKNILLKNIKDKLTDEELDYLGIK